MSPESDRAWRRRQQQLDEEERVAHERGWAGRPNVPPRWDHTYSRCNGSKYFTHRFVMNRGGTLVCEFCGHTEAECRVPRG